MKERPIIFNTENVKAILEGRKTQTRRVIKHPEKYDHIRDCAFCCPYGQVGDRLWVREAFVIETDVTEEPSGRPFKYDYEWGLLIPHYKATDPDPELVDEEDRKIGWRPSIHMPRWASRITLEITEIRVERLQEITDSDIAQEGIEITFHKPGDFGIDNPCTTGVVDLPNGHRVYSTARECWIRLWDSLNAKRGYSWESNCWVWVISFKPVKEGKDERD
jgi:hypothetical protein